jgi:uncharacterized membrane protein YbhN (UPF0104 family)
VSASIRSTTSSLYSIPSRRPKLTVTLESPGSRRTLSRSLAGAAGWVAVAVIFALLWRRTPLPELQAAAARADSLLLVVATALGLLSEIVVSSAKSRRILALLGADLSLWEAMVLRMGSYPMRQLLPLKSGELVRMAYLKRRFGLSLGRATLLPVIDAATNAVVVVLIAGIGFALHGGGVGAVAGLVALACAVGVLAASAARRGRLRAWLNDRIGAPAEAEGVGAGIAAHALPIILWTVLLMSLEVLNYTIVLRAFHVGLPLSAAAWLVPIIVFAAGLPATPMGLGVREAAISSVLVSYGTPAELFAAAVTCSAVVRLGPTLASIGFVRPFMQRALAPRAGDGAASRPG